MAKHLMVPEGPGSLRMCGALAASVSEFAWNKFSVAVSAAMARARLLAIPKKAPGEARPIAVGDIVRQMAGKCLLRKYGQPAAEQLRPQQLGVGAPGGVDVIVHRIRQWRVRRGWGITW